MTAEQLHGLQVWIWIGLQSGCRPKHRHMWKTWRVGEWQCFFYL